jgi:PDZ domain-containing protein
MPTSSVPCRRLSLRDRWRPRRIVVAALFVVLPALAVPVLGQELPPPETAKEKPKTKKPPAKGGGSSTGAQSGPAAPAATTLLLSSDMACTVSIDGEVVATLSPKSLKRISASPGQHVMLSVSPDGKLRLEQVLEVKGGTQQVVTINLAAVGVSSLPTDFDRAAAQAWAALSDFKVLAHYADRTLNHKAFGFHSRELPRLFFAANEHLKREMDELKRYGPSDTMRKRVVDDFVRVLPVVDKYVDMVTKAVASAQQANSWLGEPNNMFQQAQAMQDNLALPAESLSALKVSPAFAEALPANRRAQLGLSRDPRDVNLGAEYVQSSPLVLLTVEDNGLADQLGLKEGDRVVSAAGKPLSSVADFKTVLRENLGKRIKVAVERQGKRDEREIKVPAQLS